MRKILIYPTGTSQATAFAARFLPFPLTDHPTPEVTHLLLDTPSFAPDGRLRGGGSPEDILRRLPENIRVIGGNLNHPCLAGYCVTDLLCDPEYTAQNGAITARCAIRLAIPFLGITLCGCPVLVLGWGKIGKCLARLLRQLGAQVTVGVRKEADRAMLNALGYRGVSMDALPGILSQFRLVYNTVPAAVLPENAIFPTDCVKIELASIPGLGPDAVDGRGLPGKLAPESSGALIARRITALLEKEDIL